MTDSKGEGGTKLDGCHGELVLDVDGGTVFSVSQYRGDPLLSYLPLYLPLRVFLTAETFTLSSNIIVDTATFHLREFRFTSEVPIWLDYQGKHVAIDQVVRDSHSLINHMH
ncbi:Autophagy-related protein 2-like A [Acipenser ruthenus]|uniref:Autophagy-related protein 2-like A n=1 Tax=Acipenser ruthenus TaxID=7906 RepID=A0A444URH9_ACIRT|nr:Autophagy-related protein 2-like A [Acipenser ruthenus]